ncbi:MAG: hypothetical protein IPN97_12115 [Saprospiraceae bacterium]|nr:hypothetical protein [Saprospiraceae bacterium]
MPKYFLLISLFSLYSCGYFFGESREIKFECYNAKLVEFAPPEGTFKCAIYLTEKCNNDSRLFILIRGKRYKELSVKKTGMIFNSDWYDNKLGLEFVPDPGQNSINNTDHLGVKVRFFY